jgi:hypothetical protein
MSTLGGSVALGCAPVAREAAMTWNEFLIGIWPLVIVAIVLAFGAYFAWEDRPPPRPGE